VKAAIEHRKFLPSNYERELPRKFIRPTQQRSQSGQRGEPPQALPLLNEGTSPRDVLQSLPKQAHISNLFLGDGRPIFRKNRVVNKHCVYQLALLMGAAP
jgi:hypothetical protein